MKRLEYGPLRHVKPDFHVWPSWAYVDHAPFPYKTRSDHRSTTGRIVSLGTPCRVARRQGQIIMTFPGRPLGSVILDGKEWSVDGAPTLDLSQLALCA